MGFKKLAITTASVLALTALVACGNDDEKEKEKEPETEVVDNETENEAGTEAEGTETEVSEEVDAEDETEAVDTDTKEIEDAALAAIDKNVLSAEEENLDMYMETLSERHQSDEVRQSNQNIFDFYDIDYEISDVEFIEIEEDRVVIDVVQTTVATQVKEGYQFEDNEALARHTLVRENGEFKFDNTEVLERKPLN